MNPEKVWLIGSGGMAQDYARVLASLQQPFTVVGRGATRAASFRQAIGCDVLEGGVAAALASEPVPTRAIVATGLETLADLSCQLIEAGVSELLVEKPAGLSRADVDAVVTHAQARGAKVFVAYNRRFHASVQMARELAAADGGLLSVTFDFTEMSDRIAKMDKPELVKQRWLIANSTHVIDLAFFVAGAPAAWEAYTSGGLDWHPAAAIFTGAGITEQGVAFSYHSNWAGPGRWGMELVTPKRRLILRPLERLFTVDAPLASPVEYPLDLSLDTDFKPGLYRQTEAFLAGDKRTLCDIARHGEMMRVYEKIAGYA